MLFSALVVVLLFQCSFSLIVFNTKAFVDGESLPVTVFAQQRPEDAVQDFIREHWQNLNGDYENIAAELLDYICPLMKKNSEIEGYEEVFVQCDAAGSRAPRPVLVSIDMKPLFPKSPSLITPTLHVRESYPTSFFVSMICDQVACDLEGKQDLHQIIEVYIANAKPPNPSPTVNTKSKQGEL